MSDLTPSEQSAEPTSEPDVPSLGAEQELEVDLAAFLPDGVELGEATVIDDEIVVVATDDGVVAVEEIVVATEDEVVVVDEVVAVSAPTAPPSAPPVDLEALSQIERDLDAVDAAIAALDAGTYGTDPVTGQPIDDTLLAEDPTRLS